MNPAKIKICFFNSCKVWGGGEKWHFDVARGINKELFESLIVSNPESELIKNAELEGIYVQKFKVSNLSFLNPVKIWRLVVFFKKNKFAIIILNLPSDLKLAGIAARLAGIERIVYRRGSAIPIKNSFLNKFLFKKIITEIIANSEETKNTILSKNPSLFNKDKISVIYNGIEKDKYPQISTITIPDFKNNPIIIGNIGRLDFQKAQAFLIELSKKLKELNFPHKVLIAGDGPLKSELKAQIRMRKLSENIELKGFVKDIPEFLSHIDIFVLTSRWEGFGYVLAEAMASYKPCVAFNLSSNPELIKNNYNGFLIEPFDIDQMAEYIVKITNSPELYKNFCLNGRKTFEEKFTFDTMISRVEELLLRQNPDL